MADRLRNARPSNRALLSARLAVFRLRRVTRLVNHLIYPIPDLVMLLGVHPTMIDGVTVGPPRWLSKRRLSARSLIYYAEILGHRSLKANHPCFRLGEMKPLQRHSGWRKSSCPGFVKRSLHPPVCGAQAVSPDGKLIDDFLFGYHPAHDPYP